MMKLLVQEFLENHSFRELQEKHGVYASFAKGGYKWSLNYDMLEAKENDPLSQECRGLILSSVDGKPLYCQLDTNGKRHYEDIIPGETKILGYPMDRFFNYGQGSAVDIDWSDPNLAVLEKLDGTLCIVYHDPFVDQLCVATRAVPEADLLMDNGLFTFRTLFEKAFRETTGYVLDYSFFDPNYTYCFELTTPYNRIVVNYPDNGLTLLAVRNLTSLEEEDPHSRMRRDLIPNMPVVQSYKFTSVNDLIDWVSSLNPLEHEGVVVRDGQFNRIKIKNAQYIAYNKVRDALGTSERNCIELILGGRDDDVVSMLPDEIVKNLQKLKTGLQLATKRHDEWLNSVLIAMKATNASDKKTFALLVHDLSKNHRGVWPAFFFQAFDNKVANMHDFIQKNRKEGTWGNTFLDKMLELSKIFQPDI